MASSDEDEDLQLAIRMSLQADYGQNCKPEASTAKDIQREDETAADLPAQSAPQTSSTVSEDSKSSQVDHQAMPAAGIAGMDRKAMERERLARAAARTPGSQKRPISLSPDAPKSSDDAPKRAKLKGTMSSGKASSSIDGTTGPTRVAALSESTGAATTTPSISYPKGTVKRTWALGYERDNDIKLEEVLCKQDLRNAVFSSFQWDITWLLRKIDTKRTKIMLVMQAADEETRNEYREDSAGIPNLRICFPSMEGQINCMHSKLMLLNYGNHLRIVVPTANLVPYDWGETGIMENSVFLIDLPRLPDDVPQDTTHLTDFGRQLLNFLEAQGLDSMTAQLLKFDFSQTADMAFIHTIGGAHFGADLEQTGHPGLSSSIQRLGLKSTPDLQLDCISASIGSLNMDFISEIYTAALGRKNRKIASTQGTADVKNFFKPRSASASAGSSSSSKQEKDVPVDVVEKRVRIHFPTNETVRRSKGKENNAGTICLNREYWESSKFPKSLMRNHISTRRGLLSHNKILLGWGIRSPTTDESVGSNSTTATPKPIAWIYVGSANLSESAWGKVVTDRSRKEPKLNCRNWECGVLLPVRGVAKKAPGAGKEDDDVEVPGMEVFKGVLDVPCEVPGRVYGEEKPWFFRG